MFYTCYCPDMQIHINNEIPPDQHSHVAGLLCHCGLPVSDLKQVNWHTFIIAEKNASLVGVGGLESIGASLLLRSVAVTEAERGHGLAARIINQLMESINPDKQSAVFLLTLDAEDYFGSKFGFQPIKRVDAPEDIQNSSQFLGVCPASATLMVKKW